MKSHTVTVRGVVIALIVLLLAACSSVPSELKSTAETLNSDIAKARDSVDKSAKAFDGLLKQPQNAFMQGYSPADLHRDRFTQARSKLDEASKAYESQVQTRLDNYDETKRAELEKALAATTALKNAALQLAAEPATWIATVAATKADTDGLIKRATTASNSVLTDSTLLGKEVSSAQSEYEPQKAELASRLKPSSDAQKATLAGLTTAQSESQKSNPNYAVIATGLAAVDVERTKYLDHAEKLRGDIASLPGSETHTMLDLRVDTFVEIGRSSWDENSDYASETEYAYERQVDIPTGDYFAARLGETVAKYMPGLFSDDFGMENGTDRAMWDKLKIDPLEKFPGGDNAAEYFVDEIEDTFCQKIRVLKNGKPDSSGRPAPADNYCSQYDKPSEISDGVYWIEAEELNAEAIGMDVYSKGVGDFADQASFAATPPGLVYVGDPATGEWQQDNNGNSFWVFYGQYRLFSDLIGGPRPYHYRSEYDTWNRDHRRKDTPYYATVGGSPRYGAKSPQTSSRFPGTTFVNSGLNNATVRNAGPVARSGGPGNGGK